MICKCIYCGHVYGHKPGPSSPAGLVTHGICPVCNRVISADIDLTPEQVRERSTVPACQRRIRWVYDD